MNQIFPTVGTSCTYDNLTIFLLRGTDRLDGRRYNVLGEALEAGSVRIYETGVVGQLEAENTSQDLDVFIQAGDVLKGGRQDRTIGVDFIIPAKSGRIPVPAFCVESGRWHRRSREEADSHFSSSSHSLYKRSARLAAKLAQNQSAVWDGVAESQSALASSLKKSLHSAASPTSYQLSVEHPELVESRATYAKALLGAIDEIPDVVGYAFYVNGERNTVDFYASSDLFRKLWGKLLDIAILEAIAAKVEARKAAGAKAADVRKWLKEAASATLQDERTVAPRERIITKNHKNSVIFETYDTATEAGASLHTNIVAREG